jgi:HK97 family phage prohead protease
VTKEHGPIEIRVAQFEQVDYPRREIDVIVVPYDEWTSVPYAGRIVEESIAPGAFGAVANRAHKFLVNLEHDHADWVGNTDRLQPDDPKGLRAVLKIRDARGELGDHLDQVLRDAAGGFLSASIGMGVARDDQTWDKNRRRVHRAYLDHIALTKQPAYAGAEVVAVRSPIRVVPASATPNLDRVLAERRDAAYSHP